MDTLTLLESVQAIARNGLHYADNPYDIERYEALLELCLQSYSDILSQPPDALKAQLTRELGQVTPKIGSDAAVFNEQGDILLMERTDGSGWCLPCGWVEPNEKPSDTAIRETKEETGLDVEIVRLVGVFTREANVYGVHSMIAVVHLCKITGGTLTLSHEGLDLAYWSLKDVPKWHASHEKYATIARNMWANEKPILAISD